MVCVCVNSYKFGTLQTCFADDCIQAVQAPSLFDFFLGESVFSFSMEVFGDNSSLCNTLGFLQKNNSLDEKGRLAGQKNLLSCDNSDRDARFRRTETDFSNLFARGENTAQNETISIHVRASLKKAQRDMFM